MSSEGQKVASLYGDVNVKDNATKPLGGIRDQFSNFASSVTGAGKALRDTGKKLTTFVTVPLVGAATAAVSLALDFGDSMANISSVTGATGKDLDAIKSQLLEVGANSVAGPQAVADAFYDIAGGVADASVRMPTLLAAVKLSEAGASDLGATTQTLVSIMNSYKFSADEAAFASDVLTRTVGMGVGSMDEFGAAMGPIAGIANTLGIKFDDLGAMMAYLTTQGNTTGQSATALQAAMVSLLNPNAELAKQFKKMGVASGSALIEQYGLAGAMNELYKATGGSQDALVKMLGSTEAFRAMTALAGDDFAEFATEFTDGVTGATDAAAALQAQSAKQGLSRFFNKIKAIGIQLGDIFVPYLVKAADFLGQLVDQMMAASPAILPLIAAGAAFLAILGPLTAVVGALLSPIGLLVAGVVALGAAFASNFMGIRDAVQPVIDWLGGIFGSIVAGVQAFVADVNAIGLGAAIEKWFNAGVDWLKTEGKSIFEGAIKTAITFAGDAITWIKTNAPDIAAAVVLWLQGAVDWLSNQAKPIFEAGVKAALKFADDAGAWLKTNAPNIAAGIVLWLQGAIDWLSNQAKPIFEGAVKMAVNFAASVGEWLKANGPDIAAGVILWFQGAVDWLSNNAKTLFDAAVAKAIQFTTSIGDWIKTNGPDIVAGVTLWLQGGIDWLSTNAKTLIENAVKSAIGFAADIGQWFLDNAPDIAYGIGKWINSGVSWLLNTGKTLISNALAALFGGGGGDQAATQVADGAQRAAGGAVEGMQRAAADMPSIFETAFQALQTLFGTVFGADGILMSFVEGMFGLENGSIAKLWNGLFGEGGTLDTIIQGVKTWFQTALEDVASFFSVVKNAALNAGRSIIRTFGGPLAEILKLLAVAAEVAGNHDLANQLAGAWVGLQALMAPTEDTGGGGSFRDKGGIGAANEGYHVFGRGEQMRDREVFVPRTAGDFVPIGSGGGGSQSITYNYTLNGVQNLGSALDQLERRAIRRNKTVLTPKRGAKNRG